VQTALIFVGELVFLFFLSKILILDLGQLIFRLSGSSRATVFILAFLFLPGTAIHEMAHVLAAVLLRVPVGDIDLMPKVDGRKIKLGSVPVGFADPFRMFIIGAAPFLAGTTLIILTLVIAGRLGFLDIWWGLILAGYVVFEICNTMFSSQRDMEGAVELLGVIFLVSGVLYLAGVRFEVNLAAFLEKLTPEFLPGSRFLLVPIVINIVIILVSRFLRRIMKK